MSLGLVLLFVPSIVPAASAVGFAFALFLEHLLHNVIGGLLGDSRLLNYISVMKKRPSNIKSEKSSKPQSSRFDSPEQEAYLNLWRTYDRLRAIEDDLFAPRGITSQQYNVLRLLAAHHPKPVPTLTIADRMISKAPDITRMLDKLEAASFIQRTRPLENRRLVLISITSGGLGLLREIAKPLQECHSIQLGHLSREELEQLVSLLKNARKPHENDQNPWQ